MPDFRREAQFVGERIIGELCDPARYKSCVTSDGVTKRLLIYEDTAGDTRLTLEAPTYRDLYTAALFAWNAHTMMKRGF